MLKFLINFIFQFILVTSRYELSNYFWLDFITGRYKRSNMDLS